MKNLMNSAKGIIERADDKLNEFHLKNEVHRMVCKALKAGNGKIISAICEQLKFLDDLEACKSERDIFMLVRGKNE